MATSSEVEVDAVGTGGGKPDGTRPWGFREWGLLVSKGEAYFTTQWWLVTFPGAAILIAALAYNLVGDGLRDRLDPRRVARR